MLWDSNKLGEWKLSSNLKSSRYTTTAMAIVHIVARGTYVCVLHFFSREKSVLHLVFPISIMFTKSNFSICWKQNILRIKSSSVVNWICLLFKLCKISHLCRGILSVFTIPWWKNIGNEWEKERTKINMKGTREEGDSSVVRYLKFHAHSSF